MAGDFNKPTTSSLYSAFPAEITDLIKEVAQWLDGVTPSNAFAGVKRWNDTTKIFEEYNGSTWSALATKYGINVEQVDGYDAGNASGNIPVSNGTVCTNLNAQYHGGYAAGNGSGAMPISNGTVNTNLNADLLDGYHATSFALLSGATFTARSSFQSSSQTGYSTAALEIYSGAGDVWLSFHAGGASACSIKHNRAGNGLHIIDSSGVYADLAVRNLVNTGGDIYCYGYGANNNQGLIRFRSDGAVYLYNDNTNFNLYGKPLIVNSGSVTASDFVISSDAELKTDVQTIDNALDLVGKLVGKSFAFKEDGKRSIGFIAQDVQQVLPELVQRRADNKMLAVSYAQLTAVLANAVNELAARVRVLEAA